MRLQFRFVFLLFACLLLANLHSAAQAAAGELVEDSQPPGPKDWENISEIPLVDSMTGAPAAATPSTPIPGSTRGQRNAAVSPTNTWEGRYTSTLATFVTGAMTKPSSGQFNYYSERSSQTNGTGWGNAAECRMRIRGENYGGILFSDTPTNGTIYVPGKEPFSWPIRRYEFDVLWTHEFARVHGRAVPFLSSGAGAIALNGGPAESGWDKQAALVGGAGSDVRLVRFLTLRLGFTVDSFKASTYSDRAYRSSATVMVEPRIGFVWGLGAPHPQ